MILIPLSGLVKNVVLDIDLKKYNIIYHIK